VRHTLDERVRWDRRSQGGLDAPAVGRQDNSEQQQHTSTHLEPESRPQPVPRRSAASVDPRDLCHSCNADERLVSSARAACQARPTTVDPNRSAASLGAEIRGRSMCAKGLGPLQGVTYVEDGLLPQRRTDRLHPDGEPADQAAGD